MVADALDEKVEVRIDGKKRRMTKFELMVHTQINKAIKGDTKAFTAVKNLAREYGVQSPNDDQPRGGVLVVPLAASEEEWARLAEDGFGGSTGGRPRCSRLRAPSFTRHSVRRPRSVPAD